MTFKEYAVDKRVLIEENFREFVKDKEKTLPSLFKDQSILKNFEEFVLRGKLLRGILFLFTVEMLGKKIEKKDLDIAVAIEMAHSSLLIHDDIIDNDNIRRGKPSLFALYSTRGDKIKTYNSDHYGKSIAIVAGDVGFFLAMEIVSKTDKKYLSDLLNFYSKELLNVGFAEAVDSEFGQTPKEVLVEEIYEVYRMKTARYTFSLPMVMAAIVCGNNNQTKKILEILGESAGIIFQIKDDEIGLFGTEEMIGKPVGSDIRENKKTLIRSFLLNKANRQEKESLNKIFGNPKLDLKDIEYVKSVYEKHNISDLVSGEVNVLMDKTWAAFNKLKVNEKYRKILKQFLEFNLTRNA